MSYYVFNRPKDGSVKVVETMGDQLLLRSAKSLGELYAKDPEFIESRLFPLLQHVGIIPPASRFDDAIVTRVVERLELVMNTKDADLAEQLINDLDADDFQVRQAAMKRLETKVSQFRELLIAAANDANASVEQKSNIRFLLDQDSTISGEADGLISSLRLLDTPEYLAIMMQQLQDEDFSFVGHHLEKLTGEKHGEDVDAWRNWLAESAEPKAEIDSQGISP